jgi:TolB protein
MAVAGIGLAGRAFLSGSERPGAGLSVEPILFERVEEDAEDTDPFTVRMWSVSEDGTRSGPISQPDGNNTAAVWSPDGTRITFVGHDPPTASTSTLWVMNADGSGLTALTDGFGVDQPAWSPDGQQIVFMGTRGPDPTGDAGPTGIWSVPATGGEPRLMLEGSWEDPSWSPDGTRLVVVGWDGDVRSLYTANADGSGLSRLTDDGANYADPAWSPDGTQIAFLRWTTDWNLDVYVMSADGGDMRQLTDWRGWDSAPIWSPDGTQIAFTSDRDATPDELEIDERGGSGEHGLAVYVMDANGRNVRLVFDDDAMQSSPTSWGP